VAGNGETGLHLADYYNPSAILLDLGLPGMSGMLVIDRLKENLQTRHIPVHVISGMEKQMDTLRLGAAGFLRKPVTMEDVDTLFNGIERRISNPIRNLLVVEDDSATRLSVTELLGDKDVRVTAVATGQEALTQLRTRRFDCVVLDLTLPDIPGVELLETIRNDSDLSQIPVIIFTGRELSSEDNMTLDKYAERIIIKGVKSPERLLDETSLFLHRIEQNLPENKRQMIRLLHDKERIFQEKRVLIVDDDMRNIFALSSVLEEKGIHVLVARNGRESIEVLEKNPETDLVLMDIMMPEMDGYEAMRQIRSQERFKKIPIISLTAKAMKGDRAKCIEAGASDYLAKPVDTDKLLSMLRVWLYQ
jgi:CheY-like chemotaxis protein